MTAAVILIVLAVLAWGYQAFSDLQDEVAALRRQLNELRSPTPQPTQSSAALNSTLASDFAHLRHRQATKRSTLLAEMLAQSLADDQRRSR